MDISEQGLALIRQFEGFSAAPYLCPAGKWTIGYGHAIRENEDFPPGGVSQEYAENILKQDVRLVCRAVDRLVTVVLIQNQFDALVSFAYNIGIEAFENSTLLRLLNSGDAENAAEQFARWDHCGGKMLAGLAARREAEATLFRTNP